MRLIVDVSVALPWNIASQATPLTESAAIEVHQFGGTVPFHFHLEMCNALLMLERRGRLDAPQANKALENLTLLGLEVDDWPVRELNGTMLTLARQYRLTVYDAAYLELALRTGLALATRDAALAAAAKKAGAILFAP